MSHLPESAYAPAAAGGGAAHEPYASARQHPRSSTNGSGGGHDSVNGSNGGPGAGGANEFRAPYPAQDGGFTSHWSQPSPYGNAYQQNQFAPPNGSAHPSYPSANASPYGSSVTGGAPAHSSPYSAFPMQQQHPHHRGPSHMHLGSNAYHHESGPNTPNNGALTSQHAQSGLGASPAYHSPSIAGMVPGMPHQQHGAHQSYPSHYSASLVPNAGPGSASAMSQQGAVSSPGYPSAPQYSTQLPMAGRHRVTTTLWEDEGTLCFQVDAKGVCVARRHDNNMINGTKLLNVCGMSRGKRDGILKNEKERIVVKVGAMHLKGVWITFARGKQLAEQNGIAELLYPLFEPNIQSFLYHPDNYPRTAAVMAAAQERQNRKAPDTASPSTGGPSHDQDYSSWNQRHQGSQGYISAPVTATQSPSHPHSGYSTPALSGQQSSTPVGGPNGSQAGRGSAQGVDRRHSMPLNGGNPQDHPGRADNPYAMPSIDSMQSHNNPASALQSLSSGVAPGGARRAVSGSKRGFEDSNEGSDSYSNLPGSNSVSSDRMFKRPRDGRSDEVGNDSYDHSSAGLDPHGYGRNDRAIGKA
ncbi:unnamed protein product [Sympodiomycopsis kandeliae]